MVVAEPDVRQILVVEDELLLAMDIESMLRDAGYAVVGPASFIGKAWNLIADHPIDAAVLDVNIRNETVFPLAETLAARAVPFVFLSGYGNGMLPEMFRTRPLLRKPVLPAVLLRTLGEALLAPS